MVRQGFDSPSGVKRQYGISCIPSVYPIYPPKRTSGMTCADAGLRKVGLKGVRGARGCGLHVAVVFVTRVPPGAGGHGHPGYWIR